MELHGSDNELWPGAESRWLSVKPAGAETEIVLYKFDENWRALPLETLPASRNR